VIGLIHINPNIRTDISIRSRLHVELSSQSPTKMIFTHILSILALVMSAAAEFDRYQDAYQAIADSMTALDEAILNITSDTSTISALTPLAKFATDTVQNSIKAIAAEPPLTPEEMSMFMVTSKLQVDGVALVVADLEIKKSEIEGAKGNAAVLGIVKKLRDANKELDAVVLTKIPSDVRTLIQDQSTDVLSSWDQCATLFDS
jgi:hypothetical protein